MLYGIESGVDYSKLYGLSRLVRELARVPVPPNRSVVGDRIYHVESGIITTWVKNVCREHLTEAFPFRHEFVGQSGPEIVLGKGSGLDSVHMWLERLNLPPANDDEALEMLGEVKSRSLAKKGLLEENDFRKIVAGVRQQALVNGPVQ
jgi:isopropylmalate/homocitrate/citramalate synthase